MASAWINIAGTGTPKNIELRAFVDALQRLADDSAAIKAVYDQIALGGDFAALASALGISTVDATTIYNLFGSVNTELHATFITQMLARVG